ncbi:APC family permease [Chengkuizengella axinellae]|uniref:APC family permease n=1 Tax=Chengkuizengella axinellae TaxID=3064388 RepID=A0ABT9J3V3_9BACL|nr:APC family permease [Chengkuizengella sp. 2205SS18-9]MDP5276289.1 APC family permease [Chengkuizengella sp. 2205SS18-9]
MTEKKLNAVQLSGLIIGPILGSGIILLPPIIYNVAGDYAIFSWITIMLMNWFFAYLFGQLSIQFPGDSGVTQAVEIVFGKYIKYLTSFFLIGAVCFGPIAVLMTAAQFLQFDGFLSTKWMAVVLLIITVLILLLNVSFIGKIAFILSSVSAVLLFSGGLTSIIQYPKAEFITTSFDVSSFGYSLLLLFWTIVGWEVIGNYSNEVKDVRSTIPKAIGFSALIITLVCLMVAASIQWAAIPNVNGASQLTVASILTPIFGGFTGLIMGLIVPGLCLTSIILFIGGTARLIRSLSDEGILPKKLGFRTKRNIPLGGIITLSSFQIFLFIMIFYDWINVTQLVAIADGFFISNVFVTMLAAIKLFNQRLVKILTSVMLIVLLIFLSFSSPFVLIFIAILTFTFVYKQIKHNSKYSAPTNLGTEYSTQN